MNKLLERKQNKVEYQQPLQDFCMTQNNAYYEPNYNNAYQNNQYNNNMQYSNNQNSNNFQTINNSGSYNFYANANQNMQNVNYNEMQRGYVRPTEQFVSYNQQSAKTSKNKKNKMNTKAKLLIGVYFFIVAVIATLLLVNMAAGTTMVSADGDDYMSINEDTINKFVDSNGEIVELEQSNNSVNYNYEIESGWFDNMCDNITNKAGK